MAFSLPWVWTSNTCYRDSDQDMDDPAAMEQDWNYLISNNQQEENSSQNSSQKEEEDTRTEHEKMADKVR